MADINSELANGAQIPLPYKSWRSHQTALSGAGTEHKIDISESAMNLTNMYSVIMPQSWSQKQSVTNIKYLAKDHDPYSFYGGRMALNSFGAFTDATDYDNKYVWRYGSTYYPQSPIELVPDSTLALETSLATLDLKNNPSPTPSISPRSSTRTPSTVGARRSARLVRSQTLPTTSISMSGGMARHFIRNRRLNWFLILLWRSRLLSQRSTSKTTSALSWRPSKITRRSHTLASSPVTSSSRTPSVSRAIRASSRG